MNKFTKRSLSTILSLVVFFTTVGGGAMPASAQSDETALDEVETRNEDTSVDTTQTLEREEEQVVEEVETATEESQGKSIMLFKALEGIVARASAISVSVSVPATFQTYTDPTSGLLPTELNVALAIAVSQADMEGAYIELPYSGFMPSLNDEVYANFEMREDIFSLVALDAPAADSMVESYENDTVNHKLIIKLKKTTTSVETLNLKFTYNTNYDAKIPSEQVIWKDIQATVKASDNSNISVSNVATVKAQTFSGDFSVALGASVTNITGDLASGDAFYYNQARKKALLDEAYANYYYIDIPTGYDFSPQGFFASSKGEAPEDLGDGYTRYKVYFEDSSTYFPSMWTDSQGGYYGINTKFSGFNNLAVGESVSFRAGVVYKKINDTVKTSEKILTYTKTVTEEWKFNKSARHSTGTGVGDSIIETSILNSPGKTVYAAGNGDYGNAATTKNLGLNAIKDFNIVLYQKSTGSQKVSFSSLNVQGTRETSDVALTQYKVNFEIKNALTLATRQEDSSLYSGSQKITLPTLSNGEYIDKIMVVPMGVSGTEEGHLPSKNGLNIYYLTKNWDTKYWPDGSEISQSQAYQVPMGLTTNYLDESNSANPVAAEYSGNDCIHYYIPSMTVDAYAYMVSSNSTSKIPGDTINYELQGYNNGSNAVSDWKSPEIVVAVPKVLELQSPTLKADYIDVVNNETYSNAVNIALLNSDDTYNYYRFTTNKNANEASNDLVSFKIPVTFKLAAGTATGTYTIPTVAVSGDNFVQAIKAVNNLNDTDVIKFGYNNETSRYTAIKSGHTATTVASLTKLTGSTASRANAVSSWTAATYFGVEKNTNPQMKSEIQNAGNTTFTSIRLYNILPYDGDARGSSGNIEFTGLSGGTGTVYYTTKSVSSLPTYAGVDLQSWNSSTLTANGFTTTAPSDLSTVTAIYINYGSTVVKPAESLEAILNFKVPNADDQMAVNQFVYSAKEQGTSTQLNVASEEVTFSTEIGQVIFHENTPTVTEGTVMNMPEPSSQTVVLNAIKKGSITLSSKEPVLLGYTFENWKDNVNNKTYNPGETIDFDKTVDPNTLLDLNAVWKANTYKIAFDKNGGSGSMATQSMTYDVEKELSENGFTRVGYTFKGWNTKADGTGTSYTDEAAVKNLADSGEVTLYADWETNTFTVKFNRNDGTGSMVDQVFTYDTEKRLSTNSFARIGYTFDGWNTLANGNGTDYSNEAIVKNLATSGDVTLYAQWKANTYGITYELNGGTNASGNPTSYTYGIGVTSFEAPTKAGHTFLGWEDELGNVVTSITATDTGLKTLVAQFEANTYGIAYELNGGTNASGNPTSYTYGIGVTSFEAPTKAGHTFLGWEDELGNAVTSISTDDQGMKTLIALWDVNVYQITYNLNGGVNHPNNPTSYTYGIGVEALEAPTKAGHTFKGWISSPTSLVRSLLAINPTSMTKSSISTTDLGDMTLEAQWEKDEESVIISKPSVDPGSSSMVGGSTINTGDETNVVVLYGILFASLVGMLVIIKRKKEQ